ncbi:hypothetical protein INR49_003313 [Caranx melampygus]|nr:hypothetical protein INR49_003313 [Caranx melampygus]
MAANARSLLTLLQRCVAVRQLTAPAAVTTRAGVLSSRSGFIQQPHRTWTSRTGCVQRLCRPQCTVTGSQLSLCTKAGAPCEDEYPPLPAYQADSEPQRKEVYIVQVKGLPWSCTAQDLLQFFSECRIRDGVKGIHLTVDRLGRPSGRAFIEMEHEADVGKALEKHRQYLGPRYVEVFEVTNSDAESILKKALQAPADTGVVRLRGLPFACTEADVTHFFSEKKSEYKTSALFQVWTSWRTGSPSSQTTEDGGPVRPLCSFSSQESADEALKRDREVIGNRYIEVFPSRNSEIISTWRKRTSSAPPPPPPPPPPPHTNTHPTNRSINPPQTNTRAEYSPSSAVLLHYIHIRGLPFQVSGEDIVKFFSPLVVSRILIECGPDGKLSGEADVYFSCHQDAVAAMSKDRMYIGERYVELFLNSDGDRR